jgi:hypothetical protein
LATIIITATSTLLLLFELNPSPVFVNCLSLAILPVLYY